MLSRWLTIADESFSVNNRSHFNADIYLMSKLGRTESWGSCFVFFLSTNRPHEHLITFLVCTESSDEPLSKICCTCASFSWDLVALLGECKSSVISHKKLIPLQMFVLGKHQHDCITEKYDFRVNSSYLTSLDRREALITPNKCHGTFRIAWKARPRIFFRNVASDLTQNNKTW